MGNLDENLDAIVIGAGPAGLMAADALASAGRDVTLFEAMPSPARKFLMAGKSGLNLTKDQALDGFLQSYGTLAPQLENALRGFGPTEVQAWAATLDQEVFTGSTGRVFPKAMKASPLVRAWMARLDGMGVGLRRRWAWSGYDGAAHMFKTPDGDVNISAKTTVLAMGGASWSRLGATGAWAQTMPDGAAAPFLGSNSGLRVAWSDHMSRHFGSPVKGVALKAGGKTDRGEFVITRKGLEGGGLYGLTPQLRDGANLTIDLLPDRGAAWIAERLARPRGKTSLTNHLRKTLKLDAPKLALLQEFGRPLPDNIAPLIKSLPIRYAGMAPMDEAISTAGGLKFAALDDGLMLRDWPGVFAAGEMLDWEAPTGGYLITACLATGLLAGKASAAWGR